MAAANLPDEHDNGNGDTFNRQISEGRPPRPHRRDLENVVADQLSDPVN
jgi:hypothetical protein